MNSHAIPLHFRLIAIGVLVLTFLLGATSSLSAQTIPEPTGPFTYICHATGAEGHWVTNFPADDGDRAGHIGVSHQNAQDIIPPFEYEGQILSQNWTPEFWTIWFFDCGAAPVAVPGVVSFTQATCFEPATLTLPADGGGVTYSYVGTVDAGQVVTVTATIDNTSFVWGVVPAPWVVTSTSTATQTITFAAAPDCRTTVVPLFPSILQATCTDPAGVLLPAEPEGVIYGITGTVAAGETVTITATIDPTLYIWGPIPLPWLLVDDTTVSYQVTFDPAPDCREEVVPLEVVVVQATCDDPASLTLPEDGAVTYVVTGTVAAGETVTVTASIDTTLYFWGTLPAPWVAVDDATASQTIEFLDPICSTPSPTPTLEPGVTPTVTPTVEPTVEPTVKPTLEPTIAPTHAPTKVPTQAPTAAPKVTPAPAKPVTALPNTGTGESQSDQVLIAVAGLTAVAMIAVGIRKRTEA